VGTGLRDRVIVLLQMILALEVAFMHVCCALTLAVVLACSIFKSRLNR
jgi:hypothetical protein